MGCKKEPIEYVVEIAKDKGIIENSLYQTITSSGLDERLALSLAEMFAWQIDFAAQIQKGDSFKVVYEKNIAMARIAIREKFWPRNL